MCPRFVARHDDAAAPWTPGRSPDAVAVRLVVVDASEQLLRGTEEVQNVFTIAGDPDVLVRLRVHDVDHPRRVVDRIGQTGRTTHTTTLIVMRDRARDD